MPWGAGDSRKGKSRITAALPYRDTYAATDYRVFGVVLSLLIPPGADELPEPVVCALEPMALALALA